MGVRGAIGAEFEHRRREDRGAEFAEGWDVGGGVPSSLGDGPWEGLSIEKFSDFGSQIGEFWCKLGAFCTVHLKLVFRSHCQSNLGTPFPGVPAGNDPCPIRDCFM